MAGQAEVLGSVVEAARGDAALAGVIPALVTPFHADEAVDYEALGRELDFLAGHAVDWIAIDAPAEVARLGPDEVADVVAFAAERADGRLRVLASTELTSARAAAAAARRLAAAGAAAILVAPPDLAGARAEDLIAGFARVAQDGGLPVVIADAPRGGGPALPAELLARLLTDTAGVAAVRIDEAPTAPKVSRVAELLDGAPGTILGGGGPDVLHELRRGAAGTMPGPAFPELFTSVQRLHDEGDRATAQRVLAHFLPLITVPARSPDTFVFAQKYVLAWRGVLASTRLRTPHGPLDPRVCEELDALLEDLDLEALMAAA
jgi:4-hydroxy-tetrahydrodipicolinate synthase